MKREPQSSLTNRSRSKVIVVVVVVALWIVVLDWVRSLANTVSSTVADIFTRDVSILIVSQFWLSAGELPLKWACRHQSKIWLSLTGGVKRRAEAEKVVSYFGGPSCTSVGQGGRGWPLLRQDRDVLHCMRVRVSQKFSCSLLHSDNLSLCNNLF